jgi:hypothetical protein
MSASVFLFLNAATPLWASENKVFVLTGGSPRAVREIDAEDRDAFLGGKGMKSVIWRNSRPTCSDAGLRIIQVCNRLGGCLEFTDTNCQCQCHEVLPGRQLTFNFKTVTVAVSLEVRGSLCGL